MHGLKERIGLPPAGLWLLSGTLVAAGTGRGVVVATGQGTEIGRIQAMVSEAQPLATPLARTLDRFGTQFSSSRAFLSAPSFI